MGIESSMAEHQRTGKFYCVDIYRCPKNWEATSVGKLKLRMAYLFPNHMAEKVTTEALLSFDKKEAQEKLPRVVYGAGGHSEAFRYFGKVVEDKTLS